MTASPAPVTTHAAIVPAMIRGRASANPGRPVPPVPATARLRAPTAEAVTRVKPGNHARLRCGGAPRYAGAPGCGARPVVNARLGHKPGRVRVLPGLHDLADEPGRLARRPANANADLLQGFLLRLCGPGRAGDDRAGVAHGLAFWRGETRDVCHDRLSHALLDERRSSLFSVSADFADHHDGICLGVILEGPEAIDMRCADDRIPADAHGGGEPNVAQFVHHLVGQRA